MLMKRVVTACVLIVICFTVLLWAPFWLQGLAIDMLVLGCGWEWAKISRLDKVPHKLFFLSLLALFVLSVWIIPGYGGGIIVFFWPIWLGITFILVITYRGEVWPEKKARVLGVLYGFFTLVPFGWSFKLLLKMAESGEQVTKEWIFFTLLVVWVTDTAAYFCGRKWGRHSLLPYVSPAKTWEGLIGGFLGAFIVISLWHQFLGSSNLSIAKWCLLGFLLAGGAVLGDLFESMMKRQQGLKDSGSLLPGHGGLLDRLDSLMMAVPIFYSFAMLTF